MNETITDFKKLSPELNDELLKYYKGEPVGFYFYGPKKYLYPSEFATEYEKYFNFKTRSDDVWIVTFPRSGTTLTQDLVWLLTHNLDFKSAREINIWERSPFFEFNLLFHPETKDKLLKMNAGNINNQNVIKKIAEPTYVKLNDRKSPRIIKTHLPISMLPKDIEHTKPKIIYVARNPKDVVLSYFHLNSSWMTTNYQGNFKQFLSQFERGLVHWAPFWEHINEGWINRNNENVLFLFYEDMIKDMRGGINKLAKFLSVNITEEDTEALANHIDIKNFKNNPAVNFENLKDVGMLKKDAEGFIRQGASRGDGQEFNEELLEYFNNWIEENSNKFNIKFPNK